MLDRARNQLTSLLRRRLKPFLLGFAAAGGEFHGARPPFLLLPQKECLPRSQVRPSSLPFLLRHRVIPLPISPCKPSLLLLLVPSQSMAITLRLRPAGPASSASKSLLRARPVTGESQRCTSPRFDFSET